MAEVWTWGNVESKVRGGLEGFIQLCNVRFKRLEGLLRHVHLSLLGYVTPKQFGAVGDGVTDDTAAFQSALVAGAGKSVFVPMGTYKLTATLVLPANTRLFGEGPLRSVLKRFFNGTMVTITGASYVEVSSLGLDGNAPTYTGKGVVLSGVCLRPVFDNLWTISMGAVTDTHLEFGADAGELAQVSRCTFRLGGGDLDFRAVHVNGPDTKGIFRQFSQVLVGNGYIDLDGAIDTQFGVSAFARIETDSACSILDVMGCTWANLGVAMTLNGSLMNVIGCRFSGDVTLSNTYAGAFVGNVLSSTGYTFTNNADVTALVFHMGLNGGTPIKLNQHNLTNTQTPEEVQTRRVPANIGNTSTTFTLDSSGNTILFGTAITADRSVTLPATGRDGYTVRVIRQAACTGNFNINVGTGPLVALAAANTWCEVTYSGPTAAWVLTAYGTLPSTTGDSRTPVDGWYQDNVAASQTDVELTRGAGRFRAIRAGSVTGVIVTSTEARTAGTLTVTVFKNTGLAGATGSSIGLTAVLDGTNTSRKATTQAKDTDTFAAGDELYAVVTTDGSWGPITADIRVAIEIES